MTASDGPVTLGRWFRERAISTPDRVAIDFGGELTTYAEMDDRSERLASGLRSSGLRRGDRIATLTTNRPEHVEVFAAAAKAGLLLVPLNPRLTPAELAWQLDDAEPALLLFAADQRALGDAARRAATHPVPHAADLDDLSALRSDPTAAHPTWGVGDDDPLVLFYTSGTTGRPKGAVLTHGNCFWTNLALDRTIDVATTDTVLQVLPQFHVAGWNIQPLLAWWKGATVVLEERFDPARALARIAGRHVTTMTGVPATYLFMAAEPSFPSTDLSSLRTAVVGGAPVDEPLLAAWHGRDVALVQSFGLTEAGPNVMGLAAQHVVERLGWAGRPYPGVEVALRDDDGRRFEGPGRGELLVRSRGVFTGYWRNSAATAAAFDDGWLCTGDVAERDTEGFHRIVDRVKDMYVSGGENVYPAEVEAVLAAHEDVLEVAVVGVPDRRWGEVGMAVVVPRHGHAIVPEEIREFCRGRLAPFKVPRDVQVVDVLPRSAVGKVLKTELRRRRDE